MMKKHTVLVIAHRLSTIQNASRILCASTPCLVSLLHVAPASTVMRLSQHVGFVLYWGNMSLNAAHAHGLCRLQ